MDPLAWYTQAERASLLAGRLAGNTGL